MVLDSYIDSSQKHNGSLLDPLVIIPPTPRQVDIQQMGSCGLRIWWMTLAE
jgi:hypothetical protein